MNKIFLCDVDSTIRDIVSQFCTKWGVAFQHPPDWQWEYKGKQFHKWLDGEDMCSSPETEYGNIIKNLNEDIYYFSATRYRNETEFWLNWNGFMRSDFRRTYLHCDDISKKVEFINRFYIYGDLEYIIDDYPFYDKLLPEDILTKKLLLIDYPFNQEAIYYNKRIKSAQELKEVLSGRRQKKR
jgi:hypothetical protein